VCFKPEQSDEARTRAEEKGRHERWESARSRTHDPSRPGTNTVPRGNGDPDRRDLERSLERFGAVVGR